MKDISASAPIAKASFWDQILFLPKLCNRKFPKRFYNFWHKLINTNCITKARESWERILQALVRILWLVAKEIRVLMFTLHCTKYFQVNKTPHKIHSHYYSRPWAHASWEIEIVTVCVVIENAWWSKQVAHGKACMKERRHNKSFEEIKSLQLTSDIAEERDDQ